MWHKLGQLLIQYALLPLIEKAIGAAVKYFNEERAINKAAQKAKEKVEAYKNAKTKTESDSTFNDLP